MKAIVALLLLAIAAMAIAYLKKRGKLGDGGTWQFCAKKQLTQPEQGLYHRPVGAMPECIVLSQVQLSRVLGAKRRFNFHEWNYLINRMNLDFVVCFKDSTIVAAVELDDKKNKALTASGITLIRCKTSALPDEAAIRLAFAK